MGKRERRSRAAMDKIRGAIHAVCEEDHPCTVRQVFYRLVSGGLIDKTEGEYKRTIVRLCTEMRLANELPWGWLVDHTRHVRRPLTYDNLQDALESTRQMYRRAMWADAPAVVEVWLEKDALTGVVMEVTYPLDVPLFTTRGYASLSYLYDAATEIAARKVPTFIYYLGDHDPSGVDIARSCEERLRQFAPEASITFRRIAVTSEQVQAMNLPTRPTKETDTRAKGFEGESVELDAIPPRALRTLVAQAIEPHLDRDRLSRLAAVEADERRILGLFGRQADTFRDDNADAYPSLKEAMDAQPLVDGAECKIIGVASGRYVFVYREPAEEEGKVYVSVRYDTGRAGETLTLDDDAFEGLDDIEDALAERGVPTDRMVWYLSNQRQPA